MLWLLADDETGEVLGADDETPLQLVGRLCGVDEESNVRKVMAELEAHRLIARIGRTSRMRLFVLVLGSIQPEDNKCSTCWATKAKLRGSKQCPKCIQIGRRSWKGDALELWRIGKSKGWSDMRIAMHMHARLDRPLWGRAEDGVAGSGSGEGEGVIPAMVALGVFPAELLDLCRAARRGDEGES